MENRDLTNNFKNNIISGLIMALLGLLLCIFKTKLIEAAINTFGGLLLILGILELVREKSSTGIVKIVFGVIMIVFSLALWEIALLIIGLLVILSGIFKLKTAVGLQKYVGNSMDKIKIILPSIFTIIAGVLLVLCKWYLANTLCVILGIVLMINGILTFLNLDNR